MKIVLIVAGTNEPSNAAFLAESFVAGLKRFDPKTSVTEFRLKDLTIEHFTLDFYTKGSKQGKDFDAIQRAVEACDGLVIASPIWNFSVPGHLKNLIDRMGAYGLDSQSRSVGTLKGKPVYLLYSGGSPAVVWTGLQKRTLSHMPVSLRYFGLSVIGSHYEPRCTLGKGQFGLVVDQRPESIRDLKAKGETFAKIVAYYAKNGSLPPWQTFLNAMFRFGQKAKRKLGL